MADLTLEIATPERQLLSETVSEVEIPGRDGYFGVLPGHAPLISELGHGVLRYVGKSSAAYLSVLGGFVEIADDHVRVLADAAYRKEEIDLEKARADLKRAQDEMAQAATDIDPAQALENAQRAQALIDAAGR